MTTTDSRRVEELKQQISDLKNRLPAHSIPPAMFLELEELEEELERALSKDSEQGDTE